MHHVAELEFLCSSVVPEQSAGSCQLSQQSQSDFKSAAEAGSMRDRRLLVTFNNFIHFLLDVQCKIKNIYLCSSIVASLHTIRNTVYLI